METHELFLRNSWRYEKLSSLASGVVLWDGARQKLLKIPAFLFQKLDENYFYNKTSLEEALSAALAETNWRKTKKRVQRLPYQIMLRLLNNTILVRCKHKQCSEEIEYFFSSSLEEASRSPDVIVDCQWERASMSLFTHREAGKDHPVLEGVRVYTTGSLDEQDWPYLSPPIPPMEVYPFRDQFAGLHAALIQTGGGKGLLLAGPSGAGKTTLAAELTNHHGCRFLADDAVYLHKRTRLAEPFTRPLKFRTVGSEEVTMVPAKTACRTVAKEAVLVTHLVFLEPSGEQTGLEKISPDKSFEALLPYHQNMGCNLDESMITLLQLAAAAPAARYRYRHYKELLEACATLLGFTREEAPASWD